MLLRDSTLKQQHSLDLDEHNHFVISLPIYRIYIYFVFVDVPVNNFSVMLIQFPGLNQY